MFGSTWDCHPTHGAIANQLWEMPGCKWIFIWRTAGCIRDSPDVHEQSESLPSMMHRLSMWANCLSVDVEVNVIDDPADISLELLTTRSSLKGARMQRSHTFTWLEPSTYNCSLSTSQSYYSTQPLIQHSIVCIATFSRTKGNGEWSQHESWSNLPNNPTKELNDFNWT